MIITLPPATVIMGFAALFLGSVLYVLGDTPKGRMAVNEIRSLLKRPASDTG